MVGINGDMPGFGKFEGRTRMIEMAMGEQDEFGGRVFAEAGNSGFLNAITVAGSAGIDHEPGRAFGADKINISDANGQTHDAGRDLLKTHAEEMCRASANIYFREESPARAFWLGRRQK